MHQVTALGTMEWVRKKLFCEQECPKLYWTSLISFSIDKVRSIFLLGTENTDQCIYMMPNSQFHWKYTGYDAMVGTTGATDLLRSLCSCKGNHPHIREVKAHLTSRAATNLLFWLHSSSSSGMGNSHFTMSFLNQIKSQFAQAARRQSQTLFQNLPLLPAPFCTNTSICLAKISLCSVSFNLD